MAQDNLQSKKLGGLPKQKLAMDMLAWAGNVSSSVMIIFVNKVLMSASGYGFQYGGSSTHMDVGLIARNSQPGILSCD